MSAASRLVWLEFLAPLTPDFSRRCVHALQLLDALSRWKGQSWRFEAVTNGVVDTVSDADELFSGYVSQRWGPFNTVRVERSSPHGGFSELASVDRREYSVGENVSLLLRAFVPDWRSAERLVVGVGIELQATFVWWVPEFSLDWTDQRLILDMALSRRFEGGSLTPKARQLSARLPWVAKSYSEKSLLRPQRLGWLNYWPLPVCEWAGFPDPVRDAPILPLCYQVDGGAWIVKLTEDPLDLERDDHVEALAWAYRRFDMIGRRPEPRAKRPKGKRNESGSATPPVSADEARQIALVAVGAYDVNADDAEDADELKRMVRDELVSFGLDEHDAARVVAMLTVALEDTATDPLIVRSQHAFHGDPIYQALVDEVRRMQGHE